MACPVHGGAGGCVDAPQLDGTVLLMGTAVCTRGKLRPREGRAQLRAHSDGLQLECRKLHISIILPDTVLGPSSALQIAVIFQIIPQISSICQRKKLRLRSFSDLPKSMQLGIAEAGI